MSHRDQSTVAQREPARALAMYGQVWIVYERETATGSSLVFETKDFVDRVEDYPQNWRELRDKQLYQLRWSR